MKENTYYELIGYTDYYLFRDESNLYWVYSFKNFNKYPYGYRIEPSKNRKGEWYYKLSNDAGDYVKVTVDQLVKIASNPRARTYEKYLPPRPLRRRNVVISKDYFNYYETPKIIDRSSSLEEKIRNKYSGTTTSLFGSLTEPIPKKIEPFTIVNINSIFGNLLR